MQQIVNINGFETIIEIPEGQAVSPLIHQGDKSDYRIDYGNGLVEVGGLVEVSTSTVNGHIEGSTAVELPFDRVYSVQVTTLDIPNAVQENAHISLTDSGFKIWAHANTQTPSVIRVMWSAKGSI